MKRLIRAIIIFLLMGINFLVLIPQVFKIPANSTYYEGAVIVCLLAALLVAVEKD